MRTKYLSTTIVLLFITQMVSSQKSVSPKKGPSIGFSANLVDFEKRDKVDPGFSLMYWQGITRHLDFSVRYNGLFSDYAMTHSTNKGYAGEGEISLHLRALTSEHRLNPFFTVGAGAGHYGKWDAGFNGSYDGKINWAAYFPVGGGLQLNMKNKSSLLIQTNYRWSPTDAHLNNTMFYSLGFLKPLKRKKPVPAQVPAPVVIPEIKDRDKDGVPDSVDVCPDIAGLISLKGCPDRDGDGIADKDDKCPDWAGLATYNGCPVPDTDKDGINDEEDKCPTVPGVASQKGCPEITAEVTRTVNLAAKNIYFQTGSAKILSKSFNPLNEVVKILNGNPALKLRIEGHADNVGADEFNMKLSTSRADAVKAYFESKGIGSDRLLSEGFGESKPIADNRTAAGRSLNRRVEMKVFY